MKKIYFCLLCILVSFTSCTKSMYSHSDAMSKFSSKADLISRFGLPTQIREVDGAVEWLYDYASQRQGIYLVRPNTLSNGSMNDNNTKLASLKVIQFSQYDKYLKFTLDSDGKITNFDSQGVDLSVRKLAVGRTLSFTFLCAMIFMGGVTALATGAH